MRRCLLAFLLAFILLGVPSLSRVGPVERRAPVRTVPGVRFLTARAGLIFSGTVLSVERRPASRASEIETIEVHFRVGQPVRGVRAGQTVSIREWAGLWVSGAGYHVGERRMLFLYPPSKLGLTSPVAGLGSFAVDRDGWLRPTPRQRQMLGEGGFLPRVIDSNHRIAVRDFARTVRRAAEE